jgi:hypothetical protein
MTIKQYAREKYNELTQDQPIGEKNVGQINRQAIAETSKHLSYQWTKGKVCQIMLLDL